MYEVVRDHAFRIKLARGKNLITKLRDFNFTFVKAKYSVFANKVANNKKLL